MILRVSEQRNKLQVKVPVNLVFTSMLLISLFQSSGIRAQDILFSQFFVSRLQANPGYTGASGEDLRVVNIYRNQWASIGVPFQTFSTSVDKMIKIAGQSFGAGGYILHDQSSSFNLSANQFIMSFSYSRMIGNQQFTFGIQPGLVYRSFNLSGITFGSQFNNAGQIFDSKLPNLENGLDDRLNYFDLNIGVGWRALIRNIVTNAGISVSHINRPVRMFSTSSAGVRLPARMTFNSSIVLPFTTRFDLEPQVFYSFTPGSNEFLLGSIGHYAVSMLNIPIDRLYAITMLRINPIRNIDAFILGGGIGFMSFDLGISYDLNISPLRKASHFNGAFELSFIYKGRKTDRKGIAIPCYIMN